MLEWKLSSLLYLGTRGKGGRGGLKKASASARNNIDLLRIGFPVNP